MGPSLVRVGFEGGRDAALSALPAAAGVVQILAEGGRNLLIGAAPNLRRWTAARLGAGPAPKPGRRPPLDLSPVAVELRYRPTTSGFAQRLAYERLMAGHVPPRARRDLRPPFWLHLDPAERFPRLSVCPHGGRSAHCFGPFRSREAARKAMDRLHRRFPLRPCEASFEPHPALPLGLGCLHAQVGSCAAPCLVRVSEEDYRALAARAALFLAHPDTREAGDGDWLPPWVAPAEGGRALVVEKTRAGLELYPVCAGTVLDAQAVRCDEAGLGPALAALRWERAPDAPDDLPWLAAWLHGRRSGTYVIVADPRPEALAAAVRARLS